MGIQNPNIAIVRKYIPAVVLDCSLELAMEADFRVESIPLLFKVYANSFAISLMGSILWRLGKSYPLLVICGKEQVTAYSDEWVIGQLMK
jgi:hypothetical protein